MARSIILAGKQVALVRMTDEDQPYFQQWLATNAELRSLIDDQRVPTLADQHKWFVRSQQPDRIMLSIVTVPEEQLIGNGGFVDRDPAAKTATFRITIGNTKFLGKGLGTEAASLLLKYGFQQLGLERIRLEVLTTNLRAIRSYEKAGFTRAPDAGLHAKTIVMHIDRCAWSQHACEANA